MKNLVLSLAAISLSFGTVAGQDGATPDSLRTYDLDAIVVTATRQPSAIRTSTSAVSRVSGATIQAQPSLRVSDVLELVPGFAFLSLDGLGFDPQITTRGFYGGGEAEYVTLLIDGKPVNNIERGSIDWNLLAGVAIESVEAVKGSASSLYGDVTVGGIINVQTIPTAIPSTSVRFDGGSYQTLRGSIAHTRKINDHPVSMSVGGATTDGYRDHARRAFFNIGVSAEAVSMDRTTVTVQSRHNFNNSEIPGPVAAAVNVSDSIRTTSSPLYRFDEIKQSLHRSSVSVTHDFSDTASLVFEVGGRVQTADDIRTLELFPGFGDSQNRDASSRRGFVSATVSKSLDGRIPTNVTIGFDGSLGRLATVYRSYFTGGLDDYSTAVGTGRGDVQSESVVKRTNLASYAQVDVSLTQWLLLSGGIRHDHVEDDFDPIFSVNGAEGAGVSHNELSPRAGLNAQVIQSRSHIGNAYASVSRSFKTPTLDQLYDQRLIPFGDFSISLANGLLKPQSGIGYEAGYYHSYRGKNALQLETSIAVYSIDMTNELDFSLLTFSYTNLGKSSHRGIETGVVADYKMFDAFLNYTLQDVTLEFGDNLGNAVKAIPKDLIVGGLSVQATQNAGGSIKVRHSARVYLDDANTIKLPDFTTVDLKTRYAFRDVTMSLTISNIFDVDYSTTGYLLSVDGFGSQLNMYPAAGRFVSLGLAVSIR